MKKPGEAVPRPARGPGASEERSERSERAPHGPPGSDWGPETRLWVEYGKIREFARAVKDDNPVYRDPERCVAPPTFLMTIAHWLDLSATRPGVKLDMRRVLHGEQEFEYLRPIRPGDVLTARSRTRDVFEKPGKRGGQMTFVVGETEFKNQRGEVVAYMRNTLIETAPA